MNTWQQKWTLPAVATVGCAVLIYIVIVSETITPIGRVLESIAFAAVPAILWVRAYRAR